MKKHNLKIRAEYGNAVIDGRKPFEIRLNDRDYKVNDIIQFTCIDSPYTHERIKDKLYCITYITDYEQKDGYVVFGIKEITEEV